MYESIFTELKSLSEIEHYCLDYFNKHGEYMKYPSSEEIIYFLKISGIMNRIPVDFNFDEMLSRCDPQEMAMLMNAENISFEHGSNISLNISNRFFMAFYHSHDYIELECVFDGTAVHNPKTDHMELFEGAIVIVPPHIQHSIQPIDQSTVVNIGIRYTTFAKSFRDILNDNTAVSRYFRNIAFKNEKCDAVVLLEGLDNCTKHIIAMLYEEQKIHGAFSDKINTHLVESMLYHIAENCTGNNVFDMNEYRDDEINQIKLYIPNHLREVTLGNLSEKFHRSNASMSRFIKNEFGMNFSDFLKKTRIEYAKNMLKETSLKIPEIAYKIGYDNESYFIRIFREYCHITPYQYRKSQRIEKTTTDNV